MQDHREAEDAENIVGVVVRTLQPVRDFRGSLFEIHRDDWHLAPRPVQWDFVTSQANVLRGVHVHRLRGDYVIILDGCGALGLADLRRDQGSFGRRMLIDISGERPTVVTIPPGVAHGIYAQSALSYLYGLTVAWDGSDEDLGCRYDDPMLGLRWPAATPHLLPRDLDLPDFTTMSQQYELALRAGAAIASPPA
jgi:dTDP-4-dehydrorhamnose 3,5-epimerase